MPRFPASRSSGNYTRQPHARPPSTLIHQHHDECTICQARRGSSGNQSGQAQTARPTAPRRGRRYPQRWLISLKILYRVLTSHIYQQIIIKLDFRRIYFLSKTFNMAPTTEPGVWLSTLYSHWYTVPPFSTTLAILMFHYYVFYVLGFFSTFPTVKECLRPDRDGQPENIMPPVPNMVHTGWI